MTTNNEFIGGRLREVLGLYQEDFGRLCRIGSASSVAHKESGGRKISSAQLLLINEGVPKLNIHWLVTGSGPMFL